MARLELPPAAVLNNLLTYYPDIGLLTWKQRPASMFIHEGFARDWNATYAGRAAFMRPNMGHLTGRILGRRFFAHRVIWKMVTGEDPDTVDHINGRGSDNRWINLRDVDHAENTKNRRLSRTNRSGASGVYQHQADGKWVAQITLEGRRIHLGRYASIEDAAAARKEAERAHGYHENHGRRMH